MMTEINEEPPAPIVFCRHCGKPPEADGDHSCPCPYTDDECKDHPLLSKPLIGNFTSIEYEEFCRKNGIGQGEPEIDMTGWVPEDAVEAMSRTQWQNPDAN